METGHCGFLTFPGVEGLPSVWFVERTMNCHKFVVTKKSFMYYHPSLVPRPDPPKK